MAIEVQSTHPDASINAFIRSLSDTASRERLLELLVGFRFHPTDIELIAHYLLRRTQGILDFPICLIQECDIYKYDPWDLPCDSYRFRNEDKEMYFFTPRHPSSGCPQRASRIAGKGYWKGYGKDKLIRVGSEVIGHKTALTFKLLEGKKEIKTDWIMHEFRLQTPSKNREDKKFDDLVLCRIHEKKNFTEETDGVGITFEDRRVKGRQVDESDQQSMMDESGGKGNNQGQGKLNQQVSNFSSSDFLSAIFREFLNLNTTSASGDGRSIKKRKSIDGGNNTGENSDSSNGSTSSGPGSNRPEATENDRCGRPADDQGTCTLNGTAVSDESAGPGLGRGSPNAKKEITVTCRSENDLNTLVLEGKGDKTCDKGLDAREENDAIVSVSSTSRRQGRSLPCAGEESACDGGLQDYLGTSLLDSSGNQPSDMELSDGDTDARKEKEVIAGNSSNPNGVDLNLDLGLTLDYSGDSSKVT